MIILYTDSYSMPLLVCRSVFACCLTHCDFRTSRFVTRKPGATCGAGGILLQSTAGAL